MEVFDDRTVTVSLTASVVAGAANVGVLKVLLVIDAKEIV
jgi:hypothetical protein